MKILLLALLASISGCNHSPKESQGVKYCPLNGYSDLVCCKKIEYYGTSIDLFECDGPSSTIRHAVNIREIK